MTVLEVVFVERSPSKLLDITTLRYKSFGRLWSTSGAQMSAEMPGNLAELLRTTSGVVLDIGPGSGELLYMFDSAKITAMYGAEPAVDLHVGLARRARESGFGDKYHALVCGGEPESLIPALHRSGILKTDGGKSRVIGDEGVFDEIVCARVLCGVPHPKETIRGLFALLKPGGRMVICEHVANPWRTEGRFAARIMQVVYTAAGWPFFMGGCELQRHTLEFLKEAGEWERFELKYVGAQDTIPFIVGELVKKS
ncbi:hypothetical protein DM02DRAFT_610273 [Periconia macrospinosa]|uniref:S-adenosyl-L-methionine-dependent methyltransferase n=1 Tax=Periconia macrospinosa TaxID=97972 RepID=A0A2V1E9C9_9PLEO|nr:hypothetical protein DM02DRAFT_610273 [Periconia macrospinosa]